MAVISLPFVRDKQTAAAAAAPGVGAVETSAGRIRMTVYRDFAPVESAWRALQARTACVYAQTFSRAEIWFRRVSRPRGTEAAIVCGRSANGSVQFIWPLEVTESGGVRCLRWIGWEHANYNMGLHTLDFARSASQDDMRRLLCEAARIAGGANAVHFNNQPMEWNGVPNPMRHMPRRQCANTGHAILLERDFDTLYRNRFSGKSRNTLGRKERRLRELGPLEMGWANGEAQRAELLDLFFRQKSQQFSEQGITDDFSDPHYRAFYHDMVERGGVDDEAIEIAYLKSAGSVIAISCGVFLKDRYCSLLTSIAQGEVRRYSPGALLLHFQIEDACRRGLNFFDMGAGDARHKDEWCDVDTVLFDSIIALDERGHLLTVPLAARESAKRYIKTRPKMWAFAQKVRRTLYGKDVKTMPGRERVIGNPF